MTYIKRKEFQEIEKGRKVDHPVIAISGLSGSGKSMYSKMLREKLEEDYALKLPIIESGAFFHEQAEKRGMTVEQFGAMLKRDIKLAEEVDVTVDRKTLETALERPGIYLGRLTTHVVGEHGFKIYLKADPKLIAKRILSDPNRDEAKRGLSLRQITEEIIKRDKDNTDRYKALYGIDYEKDVPAMSDIMVTNNHAPQTVFEDFYKPLVKWMKEMGYVK